MGSKSVARRWLTLLRPQLPAFWVACCACSSSRVELVIPLVFGKGIIDEALAGMGDQGS